jgi:hypothetical protein
MSLFHTLPFQDPGNSSTGPVLTLGRKWFVTPRALPPVAPVSKYAGQPNTRCANSCTMANGPSPMFASRLRFIVPLVSPLTYGTCVSPSVRWFVREWCTAWLRCHEK